MGEKFWHTTFVILWISLIICLAQPEEQAGQAKNTVTVQAKALPVFPILKKNVATRKQRSAKPQRIAGYPAPIIGYQDTVIGYEDTVVGYQDTVVGYEDTVYVPGAHVVVPPAIIVSHDYPEYY